MFRKIGLVLLFALAVLLSAWTQVPPSGKQTQAAPKPPAAPLPQATAAAKPAMPTTLVAARQALAKKASGTEAFADTVESYALALGPRDAATLTAEFAPKAPEPRRSGLYSLSASLSLVMGDYSAAATSFGRAAGGKADILLKALRCSLAAGDLPQAAKTLALVPDTQDGKNYIEARGLASAWASLLSGRTAEAYAALGKLASVGTESGTRREALYLLWMIASSSEYEALVAPAGGWSVSEILALLRKEYPGSMELASAEARVIRKPSSWLLNSVHPLIGREPERSLAEEETGSGQEVQTAATVQLQVGWFSREENAKSLAAALKAKGLSTSVDARSTSDKEKRWAVIVETAGDWTKAQARLKDMGYESYLIP
jgi:hypothetical protein